MRGRGAVAALGLVLLAGAPARAVDLERGARLYARYCAGCHGPDGRGGAHTFMPHVENLTRKGYIELLPDEYLATVIREGGAAVGKSSYMPAWGGTLGEEDIKNIIAHIRRLGVR
ncbi:MAG: cytochrome c [Geminicoccaceae bacterium]|nr:cytochrome c [Geminicoccaceae bacterium]MCS7266725.1 cytochrome c [Geminicoccaceae bacterium]MDW8342784.1 cytochrome c [Geminicoccaceae bacterium]